MNNQNEKITPLKNSEDHNRLVAEFEAEIEKHKQETLDWKNACIKKDDTILEKNKVIERLEEDVDTWKKETHAARRIQQESKHTKEQNDFLTEFNKLQEAKQAKIQGGRL